MASQRVLLIAVGGDLATSVWDDTCRRSNAPTPEIVDEWAPEDWPLSVQRETDAFVAKTFANVFTPPVLYRTEHFGAWSMGDVCHNEFLKLAPDCTRQLYTTHHEIFAGRGRYLGHVTSSRNAPNETQKRSRNVP